MWLQELIDKITRKEEMIKLQTNIIILDSQVQTLKEDVLNKDRQLKLLNDDIISQEKKIKELTRGLRPTVTAPIMTGKTNIIEAGLLLRQAFNISTQDSNSKILLSDVNYDLCSLDEAQRFLKEDVTNYKKYVVDIYDCDDFSRALWNYWQEWQETLAMGIAWTSLHAFNFFIDDKKDVYVIEPQHDRIYKIKEIKDNPYYWPIRFILM